MYVEHLRIPIGPGSLHAERVGRGGPSVVLLHGFGTCTFLWRRLAPMLAAGGFTAVAIDLLGHGESDRPEDASYTLASQADHVARALVALRLHAFTLVGQDMGALVALLLAASPRLEVNGVAALSLPDPDDLPGPPIRALQRTAALLALGANHLFGARPALAPLLREAVADPAHMPDLLVARYLAPFVGGDGVRQLMQRSAAVELSPEARAQLASVNSPVLVLSGDADDQRPVLNWPAMLPAAHVEEEQIAGAARLIPEDAPDLLAARLLRWLHSLPAQRTP